MRRKDRAIDTQEALFLLQRGEYGVLSTVDEDNQPYGVPLNYVLLDDALFFHCTTEGGLKLRNIDSRNKVSFCVVGETEVIPDKFSTTYESVIVFGTTSRIQGRDKEKPLTALLKKYSAAHLEAGKKYLEKAINKTEVIKITIDKVTGKARKK